VKILVPATQERLLGEEILDLTDGPGFTNIIKKEERRRI
jgi:hypothetical protein